MAYTKQELLERTAFCAFAKMLVPQQDTLGVKTRSPPRFRVKSSHFANTPASANHVSQRRVVTLSHLATGLDGPHAKALLALVSCR